MTSPYRKESPEDEVLRKIGRNVIHYQRLERLLKFLVVHSHVELNPDHPEGTQNQNAKLVEKTSLGEIVGKFSKSILKAEQDEEAEENYEGLSGPIFSFKFSLDLDSQTAANKRQALQQLVTERNRLIHRDLAELDLSCPEACSSFAAQLDEQNGRLVEHGKEVTAILDSLFKGHESMKTVVESDAFKATLRDL